MTPLNILVLANHVGQVRRILWPTIQRVLGSDTRRPPGPLIFNVVMDTVIRHWMNVAEATDEVREKLGLSI